MSLPAVALAKEGWLRQAAFIFLLALVPAAWSAFFSPVRVRWTRVVQGEVSLAVVRSWNPKEVLWVDARPTAEFDADHIPDAVSLNLEGWNQRFPQFLDRWQPGVKTVVYCSSISCNLSTEVADHLRHSSISQVYVLSGGWEAWLKDSGREPNKRQ
ncbi:MAG: rhodanese-like domain-containing protein [Verrucomicrobia bacterium]|nr:rhodanese-like domain-containing protein [Verrucomicrobiota bacterium]